MNDDQLLRNSFHQLIHKECNLMMLTNHDPSYLWRDGFEEPIDEGILSEFLRQLAKRCGYELIDGLWHLSS